ncbi:hypothetical protein CMV_017845 [Castanea mollissima]|uniref:Uncharacterized protein n=1 Tax=Castanea mollissima TaxID=60419 RepID=A0A8J4R283_9ROSI|nr:hypothetical protein CMV_017845 [Castanea mollissima]
MVLGISSVDAGMLSALVELVLSERLGDCCVVNGSGNFLLVSKLWPDTIIPGWETTLLLFIVKPEEMMPVQFLVVLWILRKLFTVEILMQTQDILLAELSENFGVPFSRLDIQEVVQSIFCHLVLVALLSCPSDCKGVSKWRCAGVQHSVPKENKSANMQLVRALNALVLRLSLEARIKNASDSA